jgi:hypothetical protein
MDYDDAMAIHLTPEQSANLRQSGAGLVRLVDPNTNAVYVLVADDVFQRFQAWLADVPSDLGSTYAAQDAALAGIWEDPALDDYNDDPRCSDLP